MEAIGRFGLVRGVGVSKRRLFGFGGGMMAWPWLCSALLCSTRLGDSGWVFSSSSLLLLLSLLFLRTVSTARIAAPLIFMACRCRDRGGWDCVREVYLGQRGIGSMIGSGGIYFFDLRAVCKTGSLRTVPLTPQSQEWSLAASSAVFELFLDRRSCVVLYASTSRIPLVSRFV